MYKEAYELIEHLVRSVTPLPDAMSALLTLCKEAEPSPVWNELRDLNYGADYQYLTSWLDLLLASEPPPLDINGFWFGVFNPVLDDDEPTSSLYLAGSKRFHQRSADPDWACDPEYFPSGRYSNSAVLTRIYRSVVGHAEEGLGEYTLCLGYACLTVRDWCRSSMRQRLLGGAALRGITVGFDSGDAVLIDILQTEV